MYLDAVLLEYVGKMVGSVHAGKIVPSFDERLHGERFHVTGGGGKRVGAGKLNKKCGVHVVHG